MRRRLNQRRQAWQSKSGPCTISESLEARQLLSGHALTANGDTGENSTEQTIYVVEPVPSGEYRLEIEEVHRVGDELWVLSHLFQDGIGTQALTSKQDSVTVESPALPQKHFRIGGYERFGDGTAPIPSHDQLILLDSFDEFHAELEGKQAELLYSRTDPTLQSWRDAIRERLIAEADEQYGELYGTETDRFVFYVDDLAVPFGRVALPNLAFDSDATARSLTFSETNVQVEGVDEGDVVETDGNYLYVLSGRKLIILQAINSDTDSPVVVSTTELSYQPQAMFLHDGRLTVIGREYGGFTSYRRALTAFSDIDFAPVPNRTTVTVFDVSEPEMPQITQETVVDGDFVTARAIGEQVFVVVNNNFGVPYLPTLQVVYSGKDSEGRPVYRYQTRDEYLHSLDKVIESAAPPSAYRRTMSGELERVGWLDDSVLDIEIAAGSGNLTSVLKFDSSETVAGPVDNISIPTGNGWSAKIYSSQNAIYVLTNEYDQVESGGIFLRAVQTETSTRINKVSIDGTRMQREASGVVRGSIDNQFSVDEHNGYLRVATTTGALWNQTSENHLFVLEQVGSNLNVVGSVEGLAPTETIYSMRFAGDRGWMVTFRKVDPVYSFDLSDPANPRVTGELKIPGYSDYLQLIDDDHLLAIGRGAEDSGDPRFAWFQEVQVSLFNIADAQNPQLLHRFSFEGGRSGQSEALIDHHAFNYIADRQILAVPFRNGADGDWTAGLITLHIDPENGITQLGDVDQPGSVNRSVQIDNLLYGVSDRSISVVDLDDPQTVLNTTDLFEVVAPDHSHLDLLTRYLKRTNDVFVSRFASRLLGGDYLYIGAGDRPENWTEAIADIIAADRAYEFRVQDADSGETLVTLESERPFALLSQPGTGFLNQTVLSDLPTNLKVQFRSRNADLENAEWSDWSEPTIVNIGDEKPEATSPDVLQFADRILKWTKVADRGTLTDGITLPVEPPISVPFLFNSNPVRNYEVYVTDAETRELMLWNRDIEGTELNLDDLRAGRFWVWIRSVFEDGSFGDWSNGQTIQVLADKLSVVSNFTDTLSAAPEFQWEALVGALGFEVEVTGADGTTTVYSAADLTEARLKLPMELAAGTYSFRVRGRLSVFGFTEWSDPFRFSVINQPELSIGEQGVSWERIGNETFEVWVNNKETGQRILHEKNWIGAGIDQLRQRLGANAEQVDMWVRAVLPDGSTTKWSSKAVVSLIAEAINVDSIPEFAFSQQPQISWQASDGIESAEVYIRRAGEGGAAYRRAGIRGLVHTITESLDPGDYIVWLRGALTGGGHTKWGSAHRMSIAESTAVTVADRIASWVTTDSTAKSEIWVNEIDEAGELLRSRVAHVRDLTTDSFSLENLAKGKYAIWVRTFTDLGGNLISDGWSKRVVADLPDQTTSADEDTLLDLFADPLERLRNVFDLL